MNRMGQPSTWAGIATLAQVAKSFLPPQWHLLLDAITAAGGSAAVGLNEKARAQ